MKFAVALLLMFFAGVARAEWISDDAPPEVSSEWETEDPVEWRGDLEQTTVMRSGSDRAEESLTGRAPSPGYDLTRARLSIDRKFHLGAGLLRDAFSRSHALPGKAASLQESQEWRWTGGYAMYDGVKDAEERGGALRQAIAGDFRLGFFEQDEDGSREKSIGFIPELGGKNDRRPDLGQGLWRNAPARGAGLLAGGGNLSAAVFYSRNRHPLRQSFPDSKTVDDALAVSVEGGALSWQPEEDRRASLFVTRSRSEPDWSAPQVLRDVVAFGADLRGTLNEVDVRIVGSQQAGSNPARFWFARFSGQPDEDTRIAVKARSKDTDYFNPTGALFSTPFLWDSSVRVERDVTAEASAAVEYRQRRRKTRDVEFESRRWEGQIRWSWPGGARGFASLSRSSPARLWRSASGTLLSVNETQARGRVSGRLSDDWIQSLEAGFRIKRYEPSGGLSTAQWTQAQLRWRMLESLSLAMALRYEDSDVARPDTETQTLRLSARARPWKGVFLETYWQTRRRTRSRTVEVEGVEQDLDDPGTDSEAGLKLRLIWN